LVTRTTLGAAATVLTPAHYAIMPWKKGGGITTEIARWPDSAKIGGEVASPPFAESGQTLRIDACSPSGETFCIASTGPSSPAIIAVHLTLLDAALRAGRDPTEAGAP